MATISNVSKAEFVVEVKRLLQLCKVTNGHYAKIKVVKEMLDMCTTNSQIWINRLFKLDIILLTRAFQNETQSYSFWLYLEDFIVKFAGDTKFVPIKNWWKVTNV